MRRITATCLLMTAAAAALAGCASTAPAGSKAVAASAATPSTTAAAQPAATSPAIGANPSANAGANAGAGAGDDAVRVWASNSAQFSAVSDAVIPMATTIMKAHGDTRTVGTACTAMAAKISGLQPEAGAPPEWTQLLGDLQKVSKRCDAVTAGVPGAYTQMDEDFASAMAHLQAVSDHL